MADENKCPKCLGEGVLYALASKDDFPAVKLTRPLFWTEFQCPQCNGTGKRIEAEKTEVKP